MKDTQYLLALHSFSKFGPISLHKMNNFFSSWQEAFKASFGELVKAGISKNVAAEFISKRKKINPEQIREKLAKDNIRFITIQDKLYPKLLKEIYAPPFILYYKGNFSYQNFPAIAVVGSRKCTHYGRCVAEKLVTNLAENNIAIVSGFALGIDTVAHLSCLKEKGKTVAVLGTGIDVIYPISNKYLLEQIIDNEGIVFSEFPLETPPLKYNFPQRNRIIAGLSLATLVIEAYKKSGALITARFSLEQGREVLAVPGNIYSYASEGTNQLIKQGAIPITKIKDILDALDLKEAKHYIDSKTFFTEITKEEKVIIDNLFSPMHINEIVKKTKFDIHTVNSILAIMEAKGIVKNLGGMKYVKNEFS